MFAGHEIEFALTVAKVNGVTVCGGVCDACPKRCVAMNPRVSEMGKEVIRSFYQNAGVNEPPGPSPIGARRSGLTAPLPSAPITLQARVWVPPHALIEAIVTADAAAFPQQQADDFLRSVVVAR